MWRENMITDFTKALSIKKDSSQELEDLFINIIQVLWRANGKMMRHADMQDKLIRTDNNQLDIIMMNAFIFLILRFHQMEMFTSLIILNKNENLFHVKKLIAYFNLYF